MFSDMFCTLRTKADTVLKHPEAALAVVYVPSVKMLFLPVMAFASRDFSGRTSVSNKGNGTTEEVMNPNQGTHVCLHQYG